MIAPMLTTTILATGATIASRGAAMAAQNAALGSIMAARAAGVHYPSTQLKPIPKDIVLRWAGSRREKPPTLLGRLLGLSQGYDEVKSYTVSREDGPPLAFKGTLQGRIQGNLTGENGYGSDGSRLALYATEGGRLVCSAYYDLYKRHAAVSVDDLDGVLQFFGWGAAQRDLYAACGIEAAPIDVDASS